VKRVVAIFFKICFAIGGFGLAVFAISSPLRLRFWVSKNILIPISVAILKHVSILRDFFIRQKGNI